MNSGESDVDMDSLVTLCNHIDHQGAFYSQLKEYLLPMKISPLLVQKDDCLTPLEKIFDQAKHNNSAENTARLLYAILHSEVQSTFHKINVHSAMTPHEVKNQLEKAFHQAKMLKRKDDEQNQRDPKDNEKEHLAVFLHALQHREFEDSASSETTEESGEEDSPPPPPNRAPNSTTCVTPEGTPFVTVRTMLCYMP